MKFKGGRLARKSLSSQKRVQPQLYHPTMVNFCLEELHLRRILLFFLSKSKALTLLYGNATPNVVRTSIQPSVPCLIGNMMIDLVKGCVVLLY